MYVCLSVCLSGAHGDGTLNNICNSPGVGYYVEGTNVDMLLSGKHV